MHRLIAAIVITAAASMAPLPLSDEPCSKLESGFGVCVDPPAGGSTVDISGSDSSAGGQSGTDERPSPGDNDPGTSPTGPGDPQQITDTLGTCSDPQRCGRSGTPALTLTDLASFTPTTPTLHLEPGAFILRGLPANATVDTTTNEHDGDLLGHPVTVRFTPTTHTWDWGDGTTTTTTPGRTWDDLRLPRFAPTDTSHIYTERGSITITVTTSHTVDYRIDGGPWHTVTGTVPTTATATAYVGTATTVIVPDDCTTTPDASGC